MRVALSLILTACFALASCAGVEGGTGAGESFVPEQIKSREGRALNPAGAIPNKGFKAFYYDRRNPGTLVASEAVGSIAVKYAWAELHNIDSPQFGGYWVGRLSFPERTRKQISVSLSWSKARILIDGKEVFDGGDSGRFMHSFAPGDHIVEVEFANGWHTTEFKVTIEDEIDEMTEDDLRGYFDHHRSGPANLYYAALYESGAQDTSVSVDLPRGGKPVVLWLSSYEAIDWKIASSDKIKAVVVESYTPGSRVSGVDSFRVIHVKGWQSGSSDVSAGEIAARLSDVTGMSLDAYASAYSAKSLSLAPYSSSRRFDGVLGAITGGN